MRHIKFVSVALVLISFIAPHIVSIAGPSRDNSKLILGCWLGPRKFRVYHADGTWGVKRNEDAPEDISGRRWRIEGDKLILTYPSDHGFDTGIYKIISCTEHELILDADGYIEKSQRYSADCQKET